MVIFHRFLYVYQSIVSLYLMVKAMVSFFDRSVSMSLAWDLKLDTQTVWPHKMGSWTVIFPQKIVDSFSDLLVIYTILWTVCSTIRSEGMMFQLHSHYILMVSTIRSYIECNQWECNGYRKTCFWNNLQQLDQQTNQVLPDRWSPISVHSQWSLGLKPQIKRNHQSDHVATMSLHFSSAQNLHMFPMIAPMFPIIFPIFPSFFHHFSIIFLYCFLIFAPFFHGQNVWPILGLAEESLSVRLTSLQKLQRLLVQQVVPWRCCGAWRKKWWMFKTNGI